MIRAVLSSIILLILLTANGGAEAQRPNVVVICNPACESIEWADHVATIVDAVPNVQIVSFANGEITSGILNSTLTNMITSAENLRLVVTSVTVGAARVSALRWLCAQQRIRLLLVYDIVTPPFHFEALSGNGTSALDANDEVVFVLRAEFHGFVAAAAASTVGSASIEPRAGLYLGEPGDTINRLRMGFVSGWSLFCPLCRAKVVYEDAQITAGVMMGITSAAGFDNATQSAAWLKASARSRLDLNITISTSAAHSRTNGFGGRRPPYDIFIYSSWAAHKTRLRDVVLNATIKSRLWASTAADVRVEAVAQPGSPPPRCEMCMAMSLQAAVGAIEVLQRNATATGNVDAISGLREVPRNRTMITPSIMWADTRLEAFESPAVVCRDREVGNGSEETCIILHLSSPNALAIETSSGMVDVVETSNCTFLKNAAYVLTSEDVVIGFGGSTGASVTQHLFVAKVTRINGQIVALQCINQTVAGGLPPARSSAALVLNGTRSVLMHGGLCALLVPCGDFWILDVTTWRWTEVSLAFPDGQRPLPRFLHSMTPFSAPLSFGGVADTDWVFVAGGRSSTIVFEAMLIALNRRTLLRLPRPPGEFATSKPCAMFANNQLFVIGGGAPGARSRAVRVLSLRTLKWGTFELSDWGGGPVACVKLDAAGADDPSNMHASALMITSGEAVASAVTLQLHTVECVASNNEVSDPNGQRCLKCPARQIAIGGICVACHSHIAGDYPERWMRTQCIDGASNDSVAAGFVVIVLLQVALAPAVNIIVSLARKAQVMQRNERDAAAIAEAVADMKLARVAYLDDIDEPTTFQVALRNIVRNVRRYRSFLPPTVLTIADAAIADDSSPTMFVMAGKTAGEQQAALDGGAAVADATSDSSFGGGDKASVYSMEAPTVFSTTMNSAGGAKRNQRLHALARVIVALQPRAIVENCTVMVTNVDGFYQWCEGIGASRARLASLLTVLYDSIGECLRATNGVIDAIYGDKVYAMWRPVTAAGNHFHRAVEAACLIREHKTISGLGAEISMGIASGSAYLGIAGGPSMRTPFLLSPIVAEATSLCRLTKNFRSRVLLEYNKFVEGPLSSEFVFRVVGLGYFDRDDRTSLPKGASNRLPRPFTSPTGDVLMTLTSASPLVELEGRINDPAWNFDKKGMKYHIETFNTVMRTIALRKDLTMVQKLSFAELPAVMRHELTTALAEGRVQEEYVDCKW